jgi:hypothetical protein
MADRRQSERPLGNAGTPQSGKFDVKVLEELSESGCDISEMAAWFGMGVRELRQRLKDPELRRIWKQGPARGRAKLRRIQFRMAEGNLTMALQLGRQFLQQTPPDGAEAGGITLIVDTGISRHDDEQG